MTQLLFKNARIFDGHDADCPEGMSVLVEGDLIREVSGKPISAPNARVLDVAGRTLMPGLIDAHMHSYASDVVMQKVEALGEPYRTAHAVRMLGHLLDCGFTTVRDIGGGDYSLSKAIADGLVRAPRFFYSGKVLSMTGGHGDMRQVEERPQYTPCARAASSTRSARSPTAWTNASAPRAKSFARARIASRSWARAAWPRPPIRSG